MAEKLERRDNKLIRSDPIMKSAHSSSSVNCEI